MYTKDIVKEIKRGTWYVIGLTIFVGFMRMITFNFKKFCKPVQEGWKR